MPDHFKDEKKSAQFFCSYVYVCLNIVFNKMIRLYNIFIYIVYTYLVVLELAKSIKLFSSKLTRGTIIKK